MIITVTLSPAIDKVYWVDHLKIGEVAQDSFLTRATRSLTSAGGKGINVSILLARLDVESIAMGFVAGHTGHVVVRDLRDEGITTNFVWTRGETRTNVTILERGREHIPIKVNESSNPVTPLELDRFFRRFRRIVPNAKWVVLGGVLPPGAPSDVYRQLTSIANQHGARVVVSAGGRALAESLVACPYLVKPDLRESVSLGGEPVVTVKEIIAAGKKIVSCGVEMIIMTHEVTGDIVITKDAVWEIKARIKTTQLKNLVGADDALLGGVIYKLDRGAAVEDALRFGMATGILSAESEEKICRNIGKIETEMNLISLDRLEG